MCCLRRNWTFPDCVLVSKVGSHFLKGNVHDRTTTVFRPGESRSPPAPPAGTQTHLGGLRAVPAQSDRLLPLAEGPVRPRGRGCFFEPIWCLQTASWLSTASNLAASTALEQRIACRKVRPYRNASQAQTRRLQRFVRRFFVAFMPPR